MAVLSDYLSGTITVTNGSTAFTGTGTAWRVAGFREGDTVQLQGYTAIIAGTSANDPLIEGNGAGHFTEGWAGASGTFAYRMRYMPDNARVTARTTALIELLGNGTLHSIAELPVEEGKVLIGNDAGQYVLIDKSELGVADPNSNLAGLAALDNISNLSELAAIAKANDQFIIMGPDGTITLKSIKSMTDAIAKNATEIDKKYALPLGGTEDQLLDATGTAISKESLPISDAVQKALDAKASYNWIINGDFTINQRGGVKKPANGMYGFDRWRGHTNGIEQVIEALPAGEYTLTWSGGGNGTFGGQTKVSPIKATVTAGNTSVVVPATATKVSVIAGDATSGTDPFYPRHIQQELALCQRYYQVLTANRIHGTGFGTGEALLSGSFEQVMRTAPTYSKRFTTLSCFHDGVSYISGDFVATTLGVDASSLSFQASFGGSVTNTSRAIVGVKGEVLFRLDAEL